MDRILAIAMSVDLRVQALNRDVEISFECEFYGIVERYLHGGTCVRW